MLNNEQKPHLPTAAEARVSARDLTEALASIEIRQTQQAFERAGTVTVSEALAECSIDATPTELGAEILSIRAAEAVNRKAKRRQQLLQLGLRVEVISALLCLLVLFGAKQTIFNPSWHQARDLHQKLDPSGAPKPQYELWLVPQFGLTVPSDIANHPFYPLYTVPDGCDIHHADQLNDEGRSIMADFPRMASFVEIHECPVIAFNDNVSVFYNGARYWRGAILKKDIHSLLHGGFFTLYPALVLSPPYRLPDAVPLTVSLQSIEAAHGKQLQSSSELYFEVIFLEGNHVSLDEHAWEHYSVPSNQ